MATRLVTPWWLDRRADAGQISWPGPFCRRPSWIWDGATSTPEVFSACDLSATVLRDFGLFDARDDLFAQHGQTLCWGVRTLAGPVLGRWSAGAKPA